VKSSTARFIVAALLVAAAGLFLHSRARGEVFPARLPLKEFPAQLDQWKGEDIAIDQETLDVLGHGDFLHRVYQSGSQQANVDLFIAYFPSQRAGDTIHSPKNCLPGSGWSPIEASLITLSLPGQASFPANRYVIAQGNLRRLVLYWYWAHNRGVASEYWAKYYLVADSIRMNRSDGSLVRVTTPLYPGETAEAAERRLLPFVGDIAPRLDSFIPH
jgi:EpsI family protein